MKEKLYDSVQSNIKYDVSIADKKAILSLTNTGEIAACFVRYTILFMDGERVVDYVKGFAMDEENELKPGKTITKEGKSSEAFDSVKVYYTGQADKW